MKKYKHIIWDWNGTLLNDVSLCMEIVNDLLEGHNDPITDIDIYREVFDFPIRDYYARVGFDFSKVPFEKLCDLFMSKYNEEVITTTLQNGSKAILQEAQDHGVSQSILSAAEQKSLDMMVDVFGVRHFFDEVSGLSDYFARSKVDNGKRLVDSIQHDASEIVFIGDTVHDFEVAESIGVDCILIPHGHHSERKLKMTNATVLHSLPEVMGFLSD